MADPSLYGARVREAWRAWRALPRYQIVKRADLMLQALAINVVLFAGSTVAFLALLRSARRHGTLLQGGD